MKIKFLPFFLTIIFLTIFFVFYKSLQTSNIYTPKTNLEKNIPLFTADIFDSNKKISSEDIFKDNVYYLLNIWASWCAPCREEHFFLMDLSKSKKIEIIGLNYKDKIDNAKKFLNDFKSPYKIIISDLDGTLSIDLGAYGVPESYLIYNKKILKKVVGPISTNSFSAINKLIK